MPPGVLQLGKSLKNFTSEDGGVLAQFEDGDTVAASVLVGADGLRSKVRRGTNVLWKDG